MNKFYKNLLKHNWIYMLGIVILVVSVLFLRSDLTSSVKEITKQYGTLTAKSSSLLSLVTLRGDLVKANPYFSFLERALPLKDQLLSFSDELEEMATKNSLEFNSQSIFVETKESTPKDPGYIVFRAAVTGDYVNIQKFLSNVESHRYFIDLTGVVLVKKAQAFSAIVSGRVFFR